GGAAKAIVIGGHFNSGISPCSMVTVPPAASTAVTTPVPLAAIALSTVLASPLPGTARSVSHAVSDSAVTATAALIPSFIIDFPPVVRNPPYASPPRRAAARPPESRWPRGYRRAPRGARP